MLSSRQIRRREQRSMNGLVAGVFIAVYVGMLLGRIPSLQLDRTGVALLGAIVLVAVEAVPLDAAVASLDGATMALLFGFMVLSAQLRQSGFFARVTWWLACRHVGPAMLLGALVFGAGALSAVFSNDIVCLAATPVLVEACRRRGLDPVPYLVGLACAANVGSAATLVGNPQNMLIGETLGLDFGRYALLALPPVVGGLALTWATISLLTRGRWRLGDRGVLPPPPHLDRWQTGKGLLVAAALLVLFLWAPWPRELLALAAAGILLTSRRMHSRQTLGLVDWQLLVLFAGLFIVNHAFQATGLSSLAIGWLAERGVDLGAPLALFIATPVLSNLVSNVPAVMLLLPAAQGEGAGLILGLASGLAGNLLIIGSIANIIVVGLASADGVTISWRRHAALGVPVTVSTLMLAGGWLALIGLPA
jgi:Na+/H+ antiporter NhaD/arsenite permease-like protein